MSQPSRDTFQVNRNFAKISFIEERAFLDSEANELQDNISRQFQLRDGGDWAISNPDYVISPAVFGADNIFQINSLDLRCKGNCWRIVNSSCEVSGTPETSVIWLQVLSMLRTATTEPVLLTHPDDGTPVAERLEYIYSLSDTQPSGSLPSGAVARYYVALCTVTWEDRTLAWGSGVVKAFDRTDKNLLDRHLLPELEKPNGTPSHDLASSLNAGFLSPSLFDKLTNLPVLDLEQSWARSASELAKITMPANVHVAYGHGGSSPTDENQNLNFATDDGRPVFRVGMLQALAGGIHLPDTGITRLNFDNGRTFIFTLIQVRGGTGNSVFRIPVYEAGDATRLFYREVFSNFNAKNRLPTSSNFIPSPSSGSWNKVPTNFPSKTFLTQSDGKLNYFVLTLSPSRTYSICFECHLNDFNDTYRLDTGCWLGQSPVSGDMNNRIYVDHDYSTYLSHGGPF